jgi:4,5-dihydroxyphthalate decarboxylase
MRIRYTGHTVERTFALISGEVQPEGMEFEYITGNLAEIFRRVLSGEGFEASELSLSNYIIQRARGDDSFVALPVFPSRVFRHNSVFINTNVGVERPEDLRGKAVGLREYAITANFWVRAFLQHDYDVTPESVQWVRAVQEKLDIPPPAGVQIRDLPPGRGVQGLSELLDAGEIAALVSFEHPDCFVNGSPHIRRLFPDFAAVEADYFRRTGHFPIMHTVVLRRDVYESDRSLARRLYDAFATAKEHSYEATRDAGALVTNLPLQIAYVEQTQELFGDDPFPYGVAGNRHTVEALARYVQEQGYADRALTCEDLFAAELLGT